MQLSAATSQYLVAARQAGKSVTTVKQYGWHLDRFVAWMDQWDVRDLDDLTRPVLVEWGASLQDDWGPASIKQAVCAVRAFLRWCVEEEFLDSDLSRSLKVPKVPKRVQRTLTPDEVLTLLQCCDDSEIGRRDEALVSILVDTGLRAAEVCRLSVRDLDLEAGYLKVRTKGGDERLGFFGEKTAERLQRWLQVRPSTNGTGEVFVSLGGNTPGRGLTTDGLRVILRRLGDKAGIEGVCTHAFRRSFACISTEAGAPSRLVQLAGRWSNIQMVERYTQAMQHMQAGQIYREQYSAADWIEEKKKGNSGDSEP